MEDSGLSSGFNVKIIRLVKEDYLKKDQDLTPEDIPDMEPRALRGIGNKVWSRMKKLGILTIRDLAAVPIDTLIDARISPKLAEKWTLACKVILDSVSSPIPTDVTETKIILSGVENAGKTSVLHSIREMRTVRAEKPTSGMSAEVLAFAGYSLSTWDLGGQRTFREQYFRNPEFFMRTSILLYVIDIVDETRLKDSFEYFSRLIAILKYLHETPMIAILLHKYDPEIRGPIIDQKVWHLQEDLREITQKAQFEEPLFFRTSIFDLLSLTRSLSTTFSKISPVSDIIVSTLSHFSSQRSEALSCLLFAENGLVISEYMDEEIALSKESKDNIMFESMMLIRELCENPTSEKVNEIHRIDDYLLRLHPILVGRNTTVWLAAIVPLDSDDPQKITLNLTVEEGEDSLQEQLTPWIQSFFKLF